MVDLKLHKFFNEGYKDLYDRHVKLLRDEFENRIEQIQEKLKLESGDHFDMNVKINVNLFQGYNTDELCKLFEDINKYNCNLTENELLACKLHNLSNFAIHDNVIHSAIKDKLVEMYNNKSQGEKLECYSFDINDTMNAYDFICGLQNWIHSKCDIIPEFDYNDGLSLIFKVYKLLYKGEYECIFTTQNINEFIEVTEKLMLVLNQIKQDIYTDKLNGNFAACDKKLYSFKKNNMLVIIAAILGYIKQNADHTVIRKSIVKCMLYHLFIQDLNDKEMKEKFELYDEFRYKAGGNYHEDMASSVYKDPYLISQKISQATMYKILQTLCEQENKPVDKNVQQSKKDKRRNRKYFESILFMAYYIQKVPVNMLQNKFWVEHICPFSSSWDGKIDIDRLGNTIPIIDELNKKRGAKSICEYAKYDTLGFVKYIDDIAPSNEHYNMIVSHKNRKPEIYNNDKYNIMCDNNEKKYIQTFIEYVY